MRPSFNSFQPQARPQRQQQQQQNNGYSNYHQHNGCQNPMQYNQEGMMNPLMMSNPLMNNPIPMPNMPIHSHFFNNLSNMPQQQQHPFAMPNHINHLLPSLLGNLQFAAANYNLMDHSLPLVQPNFCRPSLEPSAFTSQPQLNSFNPIRFPPVPTSHQNHQLKPPGFSEPRPQEQSVGNVDNTHGFGSRGNNFRNKYTKHQKLKCPGQGFQSSQLHQTNNRKRKSGFNKDHMGKGNYNKMASGLNGSHAGNITKENKRSFALVYNSKEIQQWRAARRKNFPTKLNIEKKLKPNASDCVLDEEAKLRRQQLREVLAKQAELGVEVAEVPSHYLSTTEEQVNGDREENNGRFQYKDGRKGRFQNSRHNRKKQRGQKDNSRKKKTRFQGKSSSQEPSIKTRKPTLLEKLLSTDIKRDKSQLLQVFRFMVMNSFFKEMQDQPLKLPSIMVEETGCELESEDPITELLLDVAVDNAAAADDDDDVDVNGEDNSCDGTVDDDNDDDDGVVDVNGEDNSCDGAVDFKHCLLSLYVQKHKRVLGIVVSICVYFSF